MRSARASIFGLLLLAGLCSLTARARADLDRDAATLHAAWRKLGSAHRFEPRLLERGNARPLLLPRELTNPATEDCTSVSVLGAVSSTFLVRFEPARGALHWPDGEHPEVSVAGAVQLVRCGVRKAMLERAVVEMRSPRGVLEVVAVRAPRPAAPLLGALPHRDPGPVAPLGVLGPRPAAAPLPARVAGIEARVARQGTADFTRRAYRAGPEGAGEIELTGDAGCHRIDVLGTGSGGARGLDIDAELASADGELLAVDRTDSTDASLSFCVGEARRLRLRVLGAAPSSSVIVLSARWALPRGIPAHWPPTARARLAQALRQHHAREIATSPVYASLGTAGITVLPVELEPGSCYLAAVAAAHGEPAGVALSADVGRHQAQNHGGPDGSATTVAFCGQGEQLAELIVEVRGSGVAWVLAVWPTGKLGIGEAAE